MPTPLINFDGEMQRLRFWQEAALQALTAFCYIEPIPDDPQSYEGYADRAAKFSFEIAEKMHKHHGPSVAPPLQRLP